MRAFMKSKMVDEVVPPEALAGRDNVFHVDGAMNRLQNDYAGSASRSLL